MTPGCRAAFGPHQIQTRPAKKSMKSGIMWLRQLENRELVTFS
jgi:hypothetical protein